MSPTEAECFQAAGEAYGAILADPERAEELRRHRAECDTQTAGSSDTRGGAARRVGTNRKSA